MRLDEARQWHAKAVAWMNKHKPDDEELERFRAEAAKDTGCSASGEHARNRQVAFGFGLAPHRVLQEDPVASASPPGVADGGGAHAVALEQAEPNGATAPCPQTGGWHQPALRGWRAG